ncbi:MAG: portal protein [Terriglobia bacterium]
MADPLITEALKRFREAEAAETTDRKDALDDLQFLIGEQWPQDIRTSREREGRPCLVMNKLPKLVASVVNEQRQQKPSIAIDPQGSGADKETAEILEGMVRHIEDRSDAGEAYEYGYLLAVSTGKGYWRVKTAYCDDDSDNQELVIERIRNRFSVYFDPFCESPTYADARYAFVVEDVPIDEYKERYPGSEVATLSQLATVGNRMPGWLSAESVRIAEYWHVKEERKKRDGRRDVVKRLVKCAVINAVEKLEGYDWPGARIPIIPCIVEDIDLNGKRHVYGMIRHAKDPQRQYNYMRSAATEAIALAPKAPFVGIEGQFEGHEEEWQSANIKNFAYLQVKPMSVAGQPAAIPQRQAVEPPIQAIGAESNNADKDLRDITGVHEPMQGQAGPEQSSRAILARQNQGSVINLEYSAALSRAIKATGEVLLDVIPKIYDAPRVERIIDPDGSSKTAAVFNSKASDISHEDAMHQLQESEQGEIEKIYDLGLGKYHVSVSVGPSYQTKRQEASAAMMTLVNSFPQIVPIAGDLIVRNQDWPGADQVADRLHKMLPPQLQDANDPAAHAAQLQQQLQQSAQQNQVLSQKLEAAMDAVLARKLETESRERIAQLQANTQIVVQELKSRLSEAQSQADREMGALQMFHDSAHEQGLAAANSQPPAQAPQAAQQPAQPAQGA